MEFKPEGCDAWIMQLMDMYDMFYNANNAHVNYKTMQSDFRNDDDNHETALLSLLYYSRYKMHNWHEITLPIQI